MIVAVVVTHDPPAGALDRCLDSLAGEVDRIVVVDNGGRADISRRAGDDRIELMTVANDGYGAAADVGFERALAAGAARVVLVNDDVVGRPGWVGALLAAFERPDVGAAQPTLVVAGTDPPIVNSLGVRIGTDGAGTDVGDGEPFVPGAGITEIELFTGGAVAFTPEFLRATGGFDDRWFLYYEDVDLARRGAELGFRYRLAADSVVEHARGVTTGRAPDRTLFLQERNRLWAAFRWADGATIARALWLSVRRLRHRPRRVHAKALLAGLRGAPAELARRT